MKIEITTRMRNEYPIVDIVSADMLNPFLTAKLSIFFANGWDEIKRPHEYDVEDVIRKILSKEVVRLIAKKEDGIEMIIEFFIIK